MKKVLFFLLALGFVTAQAQTNWKVDPGHSTVGFGITHMMISTTEGTFKDFSVELDSKEMKNFEGATSSATIQVNSVDTDNEKRDGHLLTEDFFDAEKYPEITFTSTSFKKDSDTKYTITGDVTMHGVTKAATFEAKLVGVADDPWGNTRSGWKATTTLDRTEFGMDGSTGMVGTEVEITLNLEMIASK